MSAQIGDQVVLFWYSPKEGRHPTLENFIGVGFYEGLKRCKLHDRCRGTLRIPVQKVQMGSGREGPELFLLEGVDREDRPPCIRYWANTVVVLDPWPCARRT